jgi:late competence protein required for DNA uptake (superfamily II DNA/RNA helicase)
MGNYFSYYGENFTEDEILNDFFETEGLTTLVVPEPIDIADLPTKNEKFQCKICNTNIALYTTRPCDHRCLCNGCLRKVKDQEDVFLCPHPGCNKIVQKII